MLGRERRLANSREELRCPFPCRMQSTTPLLDRRLQPIGWALAGLFVERLNVRCNPATYPWEAKFAGSLWK
ncbi:hypothetical protein RD792_011153 [Penstemon davidsonii]|uniref:Uncharacterized protein n=1 Tax=Penstemon davidsonii TaxID=160366 RepID=A0ABR0D4J9_9LAMI|nr:hypothetical protein RD792_011153 [Penstemon davidsonii]